MSTVADIAAYNGFWFPPDAFAAAIIGGIITNSIRSNDHVVRLSQRHVDWCRDHYNSYRLRDNSWQPYHGGRRECVSPYGP